MAFLFLKSTFFVMYLDLFSPFRWTRIVTKLGLVITICAYLAFALAALIATTPRRNEARDEHEIIGASVPVSVINPTLDLVILVIPITASWQLKLLKSRRYGLTAVFLTGTM